jgi:hypothetical protein
MRGKKDRRCLQSGQQAQWGKACGEDLAKAVCSPATLRQAQDHLRMRMKAQGHLSGVAEFECGSKSKAQTLCLVSHSLSQPREDGDVFPPFRTLLGQQSASLSGEASCDMNPETWWSSVVWV